MKWELHDLAQFENFRTDWDTLNSNGPNTVLMEANFIRTVLKYFSSGGEKLAVATDCGETIAMAVLAKGRLGSWTTAQPSQSPLGIWIHNHSYKVEALLSTLAKKLPGFVTNIGITQQDPFLINRMEDNGHVSTIDYIQTAKISLNNDSFEEYWSRRGKNLRQNMNRQRNRLNKESVTTELKTISSAEEMPQCVKEYGELESAGWKAGQGTAITPENAQGRFYCELLSEYAKKGNARVYQFLYDGKLVATDMCISDANQLIILKTTYDESQATSSPALLMRREYFESIFFQKEFGRIEFYGKVMDWHTKWSDEIRTMYHINYYPSAMLKKLRNAF